jgi:hypothetical protein
VSKHSKLRAFPPAHKGNPNPPPPTRKKTNRPNHRHLPGIDPRSHPNPPHGSEARPPTHRGATQKNVAASSNQVRAESSAITYCRPPCRADPSAASPAPRGHRGFRWPLPPPPWCRARGQCPNGSSRPGRSTPPSAPHLRARWNLMGRALRHLTTPTSPLSLSLSLSLSLPRSSLAVAGSVGRARVRLRVGRGQGRSAVCGCGAGARGAHLR